MATYTPVLVPPLSMNYGSATAGTAAVPITPNAGGDSIALVGSVVVLRFATTGTGSTITIDSVVPSNQGQDQNITITMGATAQQYVFIDVDTRFKQVTGNIGYANLTYTAVTGMTIEVEYIA